MSLEDSVNVDQETQACLWCWCQERELMRGVPFHPTQPQVTEIETRQSNHHIADQTINNKTFNCNEQFYMYAKAINFIDHETAQKKS